MIFKYKTLFLSLCLLLPASTYADNKEQKEIAPKVESKALPLNELRRFSEVFDRIKRSYVEPVDDAKILEDAIRGMIRGLDPHSTYLDPQSFDELKTYTQGEFGGVGIEISIENGYIRVITPIDDTPAQRAGIKAGDLITKMDGESVQSMGLDNAIEKMRGEPGTEVELTVVRDGADKPIDITMTRELIQVTSIKHRMLGKHFGYVRITQFQAKTGKELQKALRELKKSNDLQGLILDLRNNPGGVLQAAVEVADAFITKGQIVSTKGRLPSSNSELNATADVILPNLPIVVLINSGSASASEIVAGALQDHKRAVVMGTGSFGKGSVQSVLPLTDKRALKLTTARYFTPSGRSIQAEGIQPDLLVEDAEVKQVEGKQFLKEKDLVGHLQNDTDQVKTKDKTLSNAVQGLAQRDYQLYEALSLLKALAIVGNKVK